MYYKHLHDELKISLTVSEHYKTSLTPYKIVLINTPMSIGPKLEGLLSCTFNLEQS